MSDVPARTRELHPGRLSSDAARATRYCGYVGTRFTLREAPRSRSSYDDRRSRQRGSALDHTGLERATASGRVVSPAEHEYLATRVDELGDRLEQADERL